MKHISAQDILDIAMAGTSATLLARRWESALLVNVDNDTLYRVLNNKDALAAIMRIEGFRSLNNNVLETIVNRSETVKSKKKDQTQKTEKEKKEISQEEKEIKSLRKQIQEKLIKFATRIPIFMYLTDYREKALKDVITQLEPGLFQKVTGLDVKDFEMLCSIGVFNASLMNDAIFKFKRYEDSSLSYTGINLNPGTEIGGWDVTIKREEFERLFYCQQNTPDENLFVEILPIEKKTVTKEASTPYKPSLITEKYTEKPKANPVVQKPEKKDVFSLDLSKAVPGAAVMHGRFKEGIITWISSDKKFVRVTFESGEKRFQFPDAFVNGFLTLKEK